MHIVINALLVHGAFSGVQHAIMHQIRALLNIETPHRYSILCVADEPMDEHIGDVRVPYNLIRAPFSGAQRARRVCWEQLFLPRLLVNAETDLLYAPGYLLSLGWNGPSVVFVHDTIALSHPQLCTRGNAINYRLLLPASARHATLVATPSHVSARDVAQYCRISLDRTRVAPLGVNIPAQPTPQAQAAIQQQIGITTPYLLAVSTIEPKKNFANLISWFSCWKDAGIPHHLVIVGKWGWGCSDVHRALAQSPYRHCIHLPGYLPQAQLPPLIAGAEMLLMPSRYEGFGLPALEAMAVGTPVIVSDGGALPETVGDAGLVVPLIDVLWRAEIPTLLKYPGRLQTMRDAGYQHAATFTWQRTAAQLLDIFEEADRNYTAFALSTLHR